jgi:predicted anti-sigma-YlaC factor YlaD
MKCDEVYLHICDSLDEDLGSPQCRAIKKHLERCPECRSYLSSLKTTIALYRAVPEPRLPVQAHKELFKTITALTATAAHACQQPRKSPTKKPTRDRP